MCIAILKPMGAELPKKENLEQSFKRNKDGAGITWLENGKLYIKKGFMTWVDFEKFYDEFVTEKGSWLKDTTIGYHFRISTHGGVSKENCHPFPVSEVMADLKEIEFVKEEGRVVIHNGIISPFSSSYGNDSDTQKFIQKFLVHIDKADSKWYNNVHTVKAVEEILGSKLAVLDVDGSSTVMGSGWIEDNGVWYSNSTYKKSTYSYGGYGSYNSKAYGYDDYDDEDYWERYYGYSYSKNSTPNKKADKQLKKLLMYVDDDNYVLYYIDKLISKDFDKAEYEHDRVLTIPAIDSNGKVYLYCHSTYQFVKREDLQITLLGGEEVKYDSKQSISEYVDAL